MISSKIRAEKNEKLCVLLIDLYNYHYCFHQSHGKQRHQIRLKIVPEIPIPTAVFEPLHDL